MRKNFIGYRQKHFLSVVLVVFAFESASYGQKMSPEINKTSDVQKRIP